MITLDGRRPEEFGLYIPEGFTDPATPELRRKTMQIPGMPGEWDFGAERGPKPFVYEFGTLGRDRADMQRRINRFIALLFDAYGKPRPLKLVRNWEPDKYYMVRVSDQINPDHIKPFTRFTISFVAADPHKYSDVYADEITWGSEAVTFEFDYLLGREGLGGDVTVIGPQTLSVPVAGLAVQPIFEISGAATGLTISANGYSFTVPDFSNGSWTVDFQRYTAFQNGQERMIDMREFWLMPGDNSVKIAGTGINIKMRIKYRDKYM